MNQTIDSRRCLRILALLSLTAACSAASAQAPIIARQLPNGLQLLIIRNAAAESVAVDAGYLVGLVDDSLRSMAHLMEHVAFRDTRNGRGLAARYPIWNIHGGAFTTERFTLFGLSGPGGAPMLDTLLSVQRQRMTDLAVSDLAVTTERRSIHTEANDRLLPDPWLATLFPNSSLRFGTSQTDLDRIDPTTLRAFYARYYSPRNALLLIESALPDTVVILSAARAFGHLPAGPDVLKPIERDSARVVTRSWSDTLPRRQRGFAGVVPGLQHPWSPLLEAIVGEVRAVAARENPVIQIQLRGAVAPARVLLLTTRDTLDAAGRLDRVWKALISRVDSAHVAANVSGDNLAIRIFEAASAGDWRYAFAGDSATASMRAGLKSLLVGIASGDTSIVVWPTAVGPVTTPTVAPTAAPPAPRHWRDPATTPIVWRRTAGGLEWTARDGGLDDSVYFAVVLAPRDPSPSRAAVAAIEIWARSWAALRTPSGANIDSQFKARGIRVGVRSLPYPVVATTDESRRLGVAPTPIGVYGIEFMIAARREGASAVLPEVHEALATGILDSTAFEALRGRQVELLRSNSASPNLATEFVMRAALVGTSAAAARRYAPGAFDSQIAAMASLTFSDVRQVGRTLVEKGGGRIVILGAAEAAGGQWIENGGWGSSGRLSWPSTQAKCPPPEPAVKGLGLTDSQQQTQLYAFVCASRDRGPRSAVLIVASAVISSGEQSLLARRLRGELGVAYSFTRWLIPVWDTPLTIWLFDTVTPTSPVKETIGEIRSILASAGKQMTLDLFESSRALQANARDGRANDGFQWITNVLWRGVSPEQEARAIRGVTMAQVRDALATVWLPNMVRVVHSATTPP